MFAPVGGVVKAGQTPSVEVAIDDPDDDRLADYRELTDPAARRRRERTELFVAEGVTAVTRLLVSGHRVRSVLVTPQARARLGAALDDLDAPVYVATKRGAGGHRRVRPPPRRDRRRRPPAAAHPRRRRRRRHAASPSSRASTTREPRRRRPLGAGLRHRRARPRSRTASIRTTAARSGSAWARCSSCRWPAPLPWPDDLAVVHERRLRDVGPDARPRRRAAVVAAGARSRRRAAGRRGTRAVRRDDGGGHPPRAHPDRRRRRLAERRPRRGGGVRPPGRAAF